MNRLEWLRARQHGIGASELHGQYQGGTKSFEDCYLVLLASWRLFSDEQRQQATECGSRVELPA